MKRLALVVALVMAASVASAAFYHGSVSKTNFTKAKQTIAVDGSLTYQAIGTNCRVFVNASSANSATLVSGTRYEANIPLSTTALVFKCNSSSLGTPNSIQIIK